MKFDRSVAKDVADSLTQALVNHSGNLGIVEAAARVRRDGTEGFLVWHFVYHNEVSFVSSEGTVESLYTSVGDDYAQAEFGRLKSQFEEEATTP